MDVTSYLQNSARSAQMGMTCNYGKCYIVARHSTLGKHKREASTQICNLVNIPQASRRVCKPCACWVFLKLFATHR